MTGTEATEVSDWLAVDSPSFASAVTSSAGLEALKTNMSTEFSDEEHPLPEGWDIGTDVDGKVFYINHKTRQTTWIDPRDR